MEEFLLLPIYVAAADRLNTTALPKSDCSRQNAVAVQMIIFHPENPIQMILQGNPGLKL